MLVAAAISGKTNRTSLAKRWATEMTRGKVGGSYGMNLFDVTGYSNESEAEINNFHNAHDPGESPYPLNPNLWCSDIRDKLTCFSVHTDSCGTGGGPAGQAWRARYGVVAITKRHVLGCRHAFEHAQGTWQSGNLNNIPPTRVRFIGSDGETVDRVQLHQGYFAEPYPDLHVSVLDEDLPDTVYIPKVAPSRKYNELVNYQTITLCQEWQPQSGVLYSGFAISYVWYIAVAPGDQSDGVTVEHLSGATQNVSVSGNKISVTITPTTTHTQVVSMVNAYAPAKALVTASILNNAYASEIAQVGIRSMLFTFPILSDYPILNRQMFWVYDTPDSSWGGGYGRVPEGFKYNAYNGDSGTAKLVKLGDDMVVAAIVSGSSSLYFYPTNTTDYLQSWPNYLNSLIDEADDNAISIGRMAARTEYRVTPYDGVIL